MRRPATRPCRQEWRFPAGLIVHEPRLWLPYLAIRFDGVKIGAFVSWAGACDALQASAGVGGVART
jgi:hypothetical protein